MLRNSPLIFEPYVIGAHGLTRCFRRMRVRDPNFPPYFVRDPKASDISDEFVLSVIDRIKAEKGSWTTIDEVHEALPDADAWPYKVVLAKCRQMIAKGRIGGCGCGCRGDLTRKAVN